MAVATYFYYEKVRRTMRTAIVSYLLKQKGIYPYEYIGDFEKLKKKLQSQEKFSTLLNRKKIVIKSMSIFLKFGINLKCT